MMNTGCTPYALRLEGERRTDTRTDFDLAYTPTDYLEWAAARSRAPDR